LGQNRHHRARAILNQSVRVRVSKILQLLGV
jgi:hypothetical protein